MDDVFLSEDSFDENEEEKQDNSDNTENADFNLNQRKQQSQVQISSHSPDFNLAADKRQHSSLYVNTNNRVLKDNTYGM